MTDVKHYNDRFHEMERKRQARFAARQPIIKAVTDACERKLTEDGEKIADRDVLFLFPTRGQQYLDFMFKNYPQLSVYKAVLDKQLSALDEAEKMEDERRTVPEKYKFGPSDEEKQQMLKALDSDDPRATVPEKFAFGMKIKKEEDSKT